MEPGRRKGWGVWALVVILIGGATGSAWSDETLPSTAPPTADVITGRVLDADGLPAPGVTIVGEFYSRKGRRSVGTVVAGPDGAFRFAGVPALDRTDLAPHFGFMARVPGVGVGFGHAVRAGEHVEVRLTRPVRLTVPVVDAGGKPLPGVLLRVTFLNAGTGLNEPPDFEAGRLEARTDAAGRAVLTDLPAGSEIELAVADDRWAPASPEVATRWFPLGAGPETLAAEPLVLVPAASVAGAVRYSAPDHRPGADLPVALLNAHRGGIGNARTDAQGRYEFKGVPPGVYDVQIHLDDHGDEANWTAHPRERVTVSAGQNLDGQDLTLIPGALVTGRVIVAGDGDGQEGVADVGVGVETRTSGWAPGRYTQTDAQGRYRLRVPGGRQHVYLSSRLPEGLAAPEPAQVDLEVADGAEARVDFSPRRAGERDSVRAEVVDGAGRPVAGARVLLALQRQWLHSPDTALTDAGGRLRLPLPSFPSPPEPILALASADGGRLVTPEPVPVKRGEAVRLVLGPAGLASVRGRVLDEGGRPLVGAQVRARGYVSDFYTAANPETTTDAEGRFTLAGIWPGKGHSVMAEFPGRGHGWLREVVLDPGETREVELPALRVADRSVAGRVLGVDGQPRAGVRVTARTADGEAEASSDAEGRFRVTGLTEGRINFALADNGRFLFAAERAHTGEEDVTLRVPPADTPPRQKAPPAPVYPPDAARDALEAACREAARDGKRVFVKSGFPECGPCVLFDRYHARPEVRRILEPRFVVVSLDTVHMPDGAAVFGQFAKPGAPAWVILAPEDRKVLATSYLKRVNVGLPTEGAELAHYLGSLKKTTPALTAEDMQTLTEELKKVVGD